MTRSRRRRFSSRTHQLRELDRRLGRRQPPAGWRDSSALERPPVTRQEPDQDTDATRDPFYPRGLDW